MFNKTSCHTYTEQNYTFLCSSDDHNDKKLYSPDNAFHISAAAVVAVLSPVAVVKNGLILATIWRRDFARTLLNIFLCRLARTDLLGDLIGGPLHALSVLVKAFTGSMLSQDNSLLFVFSFLKLSFFSHDFFLIFHDYLSSDRDALSFSSPLLFLPSL